MAKSNTIVHTLTDRDSGEKRFVIRCPACDDWHMLDERWTFNGDMNKPTFSPSLLCNLGDNKICHSFVEDGKIRYLSDCWHSMKGQTIDLPPCDWFVD